MQHAEGGVAMRPWEYGDDDDEDILATRLEKIQRLYGLQEMSADGGFHLRMARAIAEEPLPPAPEPVRGRGISLQGVPV